MARPISLSETPIWCGKTEDYELELTKEGIKIIYFPYKRGVDWNKKHKKTYFSYEQRKQLLESIQYADFVIPEESLIS